MRLFTTLLTLTLFVSCEDPCWQADCLRSTEYRFNLLDEEGNDLIIGDSTQFSLDALSVIDSLNNSYQIEIGSFGGVSALIVTLSGDQLDYILILDNKRLDSFKVTFRKVQENCCGLTPWIDNVDFKTLRTEPPKDDVGSTYIYIE